MAKKKSKPVEKIRLSGRNIYTDKKGRVIFYDMITKKGYLVDKKHENSALFFMWILNVVFQRFNTSWKTKQKEK